MGKLLISVQISVEYCDFSNEKKEDGWGCIVEPMKVKIGNRIKDIRNERQLTQQQLALSINSSTSLINNIENGTGNPRLTTLCKISTVLNVDLSTLTAIIPESE